MCVPAATLKPLVVKLLHVWYLAPEPFQVLVRFRVFAGVPSTKTWSDVAAQVALRVVKA